MMCECVVCDARTVLAEAKNQQNTIASRALHAASTHRPPRRAGASSAPSAAGAFAAAGFAVAGRSLAASVGQSRLKGQDVLGKRRTARLHCAL